MTNPIDQSLDRLRGSSPRKPNNARSLAALENNPRCTLRAVLDACGADKEKIAKHAGFPVPLRQSVFAIGRGNSFESLVKAEGCAELVRVLRDTLKLTLPEVAYQDLNDVGGNTSSEVRHRRTRNLLVQVATNRGGGTLYDHPMLRLDVGGHPVFLEPDLVAFRVEDRFHVVEIKSFPIVDGQADAVQVKSATAQAAAYILALRAMLGEAGISPHTVADRVVLVAPKDFTNRPTAAFVDAQTQISTLSRQLQRIERIGKLVAALPDGLTFDLAADQAGKPQRSTEELIDALNTVPANYRPDCLNHCEMAFFCRDRARTCASVDVLDPTVREQLGWIDTYTMALGLARGQLRPTADQVEIAVALRHAAQLRAELAEAAA